MFAESKRGPDSRKSRMERWTIDPVAGTTVRAVIHDHAQEFPRYDERLTTRPYRYAYSVAIPDEQSAEWTLAEKRLFKHDDRKSAEQGQSVSEGVSIVGRRSNKNKITK